MSKIAPITLTQHEHPPCRRVAQRTCAKLLRLCDTTQGYRDALKLLDGMNPDQNEVATRWLLDAELVRSSPRRTIVHGLFTRYTELRRKRTLASILERIDG